MFGKSFKEVIKKTIAEYELLLEKKEYKDLEDKSRIESIIVDLKNKL